MAARFPDVTKVLKYSVKAKAFGQGSFGTVHEATDEGGTKVAAKCINLDAKTVKDLDVNVEKLVKLEHDNIVNMFDKHADESNRFWIFMEYCDLGDLNKFCRTRDLTIIEKLDVMIQLAMGLEYLHANRVIHRDIKPGNILVTSGRSIGIKLSDFDLSKILDPDASTSGMSSNVGTPAFKAPEYFQFFEQNRQRKIRYHRNVDVYALGLTYLALLQAVQGQNLRPQIETAQEDAELWVPSIGQLISERIKYKIDELRIVVVEGKEMTSKIKSIIQKMTAIDPKQRLRAAKLVDALHNVERRSRLSEAKETEKKLRKMIPYQNNHKLDGKKKLELIEKAKMAEQKLHEKRPSRKQLTITHMHCEKADIWETGLHASAMCVIKDQLVAIRGHRAGDKKMYVKFFNLQNGNVINELQSPCDHRVEYIMCQHPVDDACALEVCADCQCIRSYSASNEEIKVVFEGKKLYPVCPGPGVDLLGLDDDNRIANLSWQPEQRQFKNGWSLSIRIICKRPLRICYRQKQDILFVTGSRQIQAIKLGELTTLWQIQEQIEGTDIYPVGCCLAGRMVLIPGIYGEIIVMDTDGQLLQVISPEGVPYLIGVCWTNTLPKMAVLDTSGSESNIHLYNVS